MNSLIQSSLESFWKEFTTTFIQMLMNLTNAIVVILCIAAIGYIIYHCICLMFLQEGKYFQRILFGYFALLLFRILGALINMGGLTG